MCTASVIVPIYNVSAYLDECLASVQAQSLQDWELVCVDDGSTDDSAAKVQAWAAQDQRVRLIQKPNGGLSSARNAGIDAARGSYLFFLDGDDALEPDALERIVAVFERSGADVVTFGASFFGDEPTPWLERCLSPRDALFQDFSPSILLEESSNPFAWRTACRRSWLREQGPRFDESVRYGEDTIWHFSLYPVSGTTALASDKVYRYRLNRAGSLMASSEKGSAKRVSQHVLVVEEVFAEWQRLGLLDSWGAELVGWSVDYVLYAALRQPAGPERSQSLQRLSALYQSYAQGMKLPAPLAGIVTCVVEGAYDGKRSTLAALRWRVWRYGLADLAQTLLGHGGARSGSGE